MPSVRTPFLVLEEVQGKTAMLLWHLLTDPTEDSDAAGSFAGGVFYALNSLRGRQ
jgi:hypothetical protein